MDEVLEQTNPTETTNEESWLDDAFTPESEPQETSEQDASAGEQKETKPIVEPATEPKYKVKYNGTEMELPVSELITHAQKGMNYDHVLQERDALRNAPELQMLDRYAKASGMTRQQYVEYLDKQMQESEVQQQIASGVPEGVARRLTELERAESMRKEKETAMEAQAQERARYEAFIRAYPEVKEFPEEVAQAIVSGEEPLSAYRAYENRRLLTEIEALKSQLQAKEKNENNKKKDFGGADSEGSDEGQDAFLAGLASAFR